MQKLLIGAHMSIAGGMPRAVARGTALGCTAMQVFTKNANRWQGKALPAEEVEEFRRAWTASPIGPILAHDSYLINLAAPPGDLRRQSLAAFADEMARCAMLGIPFLVMHPGAHLGAGEGTGIARVAEALRIVLAEAPPEVTILIENTAGQGSYLGARFEHLRDIMEQVRSERIGVCFDTCHAFAAGYDLASAAGWGEVMAEFDHRIGIPHLRAFHLNDSKKGLGSRVDRHEHIGRGAIGREGFRSLLHDPRFTTVPKVLETPKGDDDEFDRMNLAVLRELVEEV